MDLAKLRTLVFEKSGIKIDEQDPVFALVALNQAVLSESLDQHLAALHQADERIKAQTRYLMEAGERYRKLHTGEIASEMPGGMPVEQNQASHASGVRENVPSDEFPTTATATTTPTVNDKAHLLGSLLASACLSALLVLGGQWLLNRSAPMTTTPQASAVPQLTLSQAEMIKTGEKFTRLMQKLDAKTRAAVEVEMNKP